MDHFTIAAETTGIPEYLQSYEALREHFYQHLDGHTTTEKGRRFARFAQKLIPQTDFGTDFELPVLSQKESNDEGVDMTAAGKNGRSKLYVQAKLDISRAEAIDSILSKFVAHRDKHLASGQAYLFDPDEETAHYLIVTLSSLVRIEKKYREGAFATRAFYDQHRAEHRIHIIDGNEIFSVLRTAFTKIQGADTEVELTLATPVIAKDNVFFAIISSPELQRLYRLFGDALFFENVRDFIEPGRNQEREGRTSVNAEIVKTIRDNPDKMLERNNGIVFRASEVRSGSDGHALVLANGSIVNGCQTTMCIVEHAVQPCFVPIKIVQTHDSWDVAKAANYQNPVDVIDLDIARNLRPQLAKRAAAALGVQMGDSRKSAIQIIDEIYDQRVTYEETRLLYLGLFSRTPNNVFATNYTDLLQGLISLFSQEDPTGERVFGTLFKLQNASIDGLTQAEERFRNPEYARKFQRFYKDQRPSYRCFVSILALCGAIGMNVAERAKEDEAEHMRMREFFSRAERLLDGHKQRFLVVYRLAVKEWMREMIDSGADDNKVQQEMATRSKRADFKKLYTDLLLEADNDDTLADLSFD